MTPPKTFRLHSVNYIAVCYKTVAWVTSTWRHVMRHTGSHPQRGQGARFHGNRARRCCRRRRPTANALLTVKRYELNMKEIDRRRWRSENSIASTRSMFLQHTVSENRTKSLEGVHSSSWKQWKIAFWIHRSKTDLLHGAPSIFSLEICSLLVG